MDDDAVIDRLAAELLAARDSASLVDRPSRREGGLDLERAYRVGRRLAERLAGRGDRAVGRKIGFTNSATWAEFGVDAPVWAPMYESTVHHAGPGGFRLGLRGMVAPRIEPEVVLKLWRPPPAGDVTPEELAACLEWVALGFEVVDCHYDGWRFTAADAVADFGLHRALIVGTPWLRERASPREWAEALPSLAVSLHRGEEVVSEGLGRNALGCPLLALAHLARVVAAQAGTPPLAAGEIITTGTLTSPPSIVPGECWQLEAVGGPFPPLRLEIGDDLTSA